MLQVTRSAARLAWIAGTVALVALVALPHLLPVFGRQMYVVRGASMEPTIPIGSVVVIHRTDPSAVQVGEVITYALKPDSVVTHRVIARSDADGIAFETKGDANAAADPMPIPASAVLGDVEISVPGLGSLIAMLSSTVGEIALVFSLGALLLAGWFLDELLATLHRAPRQRAVPGSAA